MTSCYKQLIHPFLTISLLGMLLFALIAEHFFGIKPCELCTYQRYFMIAAFVACMVALFIKNCTTRWLCMFTILTCTIFALYQVGVEVHWWKSHFGCSVKDTINSDLSLDEQLSNMSFVPCDKPSWWIFGISATIWTFLSLSFLWVISCLPIYLASNKKN